MVQLPILAPAASTTAPQHTSSLAGVGNKTEGRRWVTKSELAVSEKMPLVVGPTVVSAAQHTSTVRGTGRVPASCRASTCTSSYGLKTS